MLIDPTEYAWKPDEPETYALETAGSITTGARRIYQMELVGATAGSISLYADAEKTELIGTLTYPDMVIEPSVPVCVDMLYAEGTGIGTGVSLTIYSEEGVPAAGIEEYLDTTDGMTCTRSTPNDDGTDTLTGMAGFMFNGASAANLYVSGNCWVGIGANTEHLKICRRDGKVYYIYRQEGTLADGTGFLKIRWEGYTQYNSTAESRKLIFELFLFDNNEMFLNVVQTPTESAYYGTSSFTCNGATTNLDICDGTGGGKKICFYPRDGQGRAWDIEYGDYTPVDEYSARYLIRSEGDYYVEENGELVQVGVAQPTAAAFYRYGMEDVPDGELIAELTDPEVLFWTNDPNGSLLMKAEMTAHPYPQILLGYADMSSETILGIRLISAEYSGNIGVKLSFDGGVTYGSEMTMAAFLNTDTEELWDDCQADKSLYIQFILYETGRLTRFRIDYVN